MKKKMVWGVSLAVTFLFYLFLIFLEAKAREMTFLNFLKSRVLSLALAGFFFVLIIVPSLKPTVEELISWINDRCFRRKQE